MKLNVYYRVNPKVSKQPIVFGYDKLKLSEYALKSFKNSLGVLDVNLTVIYDSCPREYHELFEQIMPGHRSIMLHGAGNRESWRRQLELVAADHGDNNDLIYFAEDDYYYRHGALEKIAGFIVGTGADFVTAYDHPDYYNIPFHNGRYTIKWYDGQHYRTAGTTTNTFMARRKTILETIKTLESFANGNSDAGYWVSLTGHNLFSYPSYCGWRHVHWPQLTKTLVGRGYMLWCPVPGLASHLEKTCIAPGLEVT